MTDNIRPSDSCCSCAELWRLMCLIRVGLPAVIGVCLGAKMHF